MKDKIESHTLWRRTEPAFKHAVYEVLNDDGFTIIYRIRGNSLEIPQIYKDSFLRDFEMLSADDVLEETGGSF
jgi:hypothetical protein